MLPQVPRVKVEDVNLARFFDSVYNFARAVGDLLRPYEDPEEWKTLPLLGDWQPFPGAGYVQPQYRMLPDKRTVRVRGPVYGTTAQVAALPLGYRPKAIESRVTAGNSAVAVMDISTLGVVTVTAGSGTIYLLLNFEFEVT